MLKPILSWKKGTKSNLFERRDQCTRLQDVEPLNRDGSVTTSVSLK